MKQSLPVRIVVGVAITGIIAMCLGLPSWFAVEGTIALATTEPVRVTDLSCVTGHGRNSSGYCVGSWTLSDGTEVRERLSGDWFIDEDADFDGYGNVDVAAPTLVHWSLAQLLYAVPILLLWWFHRQWRKVRRRAGRPIAPEDEAAMNARAERLRRDPEPPRLSP